MSGPTSTASNTQCTAPSLAENASKNLFGDVSFHKFAILLGGTCTAISCAILLVLMGLHATHLSKPKEQLKILKICLVVPFFSITSFVSIAFPHSYSYINVWFTYFESIALATFFLLMCEYISPNRSELELFFSALEIQQKKKPTLRGEESVNWFRGRWIAVFQLPVVSLGVAVATDVTQAFGVLCEFNTNTKTPFYSTTDFWLGVIMNISLGIAIPSIVNFYIALKSHIQQHRVLLKLVAFKICVGIYFLEGIIFFILSKAKQLNPTPTMTYADLNIGLPSLLVCVQNVPLAAFFVYAYPHTPYVLSYAAIPSESYADGEVQGRTSNYQGGFLGWKGWVGTFSSMEVVRGVLFSFRMAALRRESKARSMDPDSMYTPLTELRSNGRK